MTSPASATDAAPVRKTNGATIRALRNALGITHGELAARCEINPGYLTHIEKANKQPSPAMVKKIADALGVSLDAITWVISEAA